MPASPTTDGPIGIVGFGHFGRALGSLLDAAAMPFVIHDPAVAAGSDLPAPAASSLDGLARAARLVILCVPVPALEPVLIELRPALSSDHLVLDVGSVKLHPTQVMSRLLAGTIPWCATHPLFGPAALARQERPFRAVVCPNTAHPTAHHRARALFEQLGCEVIEQAPDDHDRLMAETHALAFFIARALLDIDAGHGASFVPPSFRALAQTIDTVRVDAGHLFSVIQTANPHAADARQRLLEALARIHGEIG